MNKWNLLVLNMALFCGFGEVQAQPALTTTRVRLRNGPSTADSVLRILPTHSSVRLLGADSSASGFYRVRTSDGIKAWIHGHYLMVAAAAAPTIAATPEAAEANPACGGKHYYRWAAKKDYREVSDQVTRLTVAEMLAWPAYDLGRDLASWCARRADRELEAFELTGWVRRVRKEEADEDWHLELTGTRTAAMSRCVIAEIPDPSYGAEFKTARANLDELLSQSRIDSRSGIVTPPVRVRVVGAGFYDGWHSTSKDHGGCNSTPGAIWELHPVFEVRAP